jgi:hypothetical protein
VVAPASPRDAGARYESRPRSRRVLRLGAGTSSFDRFSHRESFVRPACALVRIAFEAFVRGEWLALCATDAAIEDFIAGTDPPKIDKLLAALELTPAFSEKVLSGVKAKSWRAMCDYTHTGGIHIRRWNTAEAIEPNYDDGMLNKALSFAEVIGSMSVLGLATLAEDIQLALRVLERVKQRAA